MKLSAFFFCSMSLGLLGFSGCGGDPDALPEGPKGTVSGKVTSNGKPVPEGSIITFTPEGGSGIPASGSLAADGSFKLRAKGSFDVPAGIYKVSISPPATQEMSAEDAMKAQMAGTLPDFQVKEIPQKYRSPDTSGESFEVKEGDDNTYDLDMKPAK